MPETKTRSKGPSTMVAIAEKLDTLATNVSNISETVLAIRDKQIASDVHMTSIIGPPSLEDRMRGYVDHRIDSREADTKLQLQQVQTILQLEQKNAKLQLEAQISAAALAASTTETQRQANHEENGKRLTKLERNVYIGIGAVMAVDFILRFVKG